MKKLLIVLAVLAMASMAWGGELKRAELMTDQEKQDLKAAKEVLREAESKLYDVQSKIFRNHKMNTSDWMEYREWAEINGDYVLQYFQSNMSQIRFLNTK